MSDGSAYEFYLWPFGVATPFIFDDARGGFWGELWFQMRKRQLIRVRKVAR